MREIKFRVVDLETNEVYNGDRIEADGNIIVTLSYGQLVGFYIGIGGDYQELKLTQFTGMLDEQGNEIYEGDIVKFSDNLLKINDVIGAVEFKNGSYVINSGLITHYRWMDYVVEVIGNKFENPDLLEKV